jgi:hypothetical protein
MTTLPANLNERVSAWRAFSHGDNLISFDPTDEAKVALVDVQIPTELVIFIAWLKDMRTQLVVDNQALVIGFEGKPRSGKSASAVTIAYMIDPTFWPNMEDRIVTTSEQLSEQLRLLRKNDIHGGVIIVDESGVTVASEAYYEKWYQELSKMFLIFGYINPCIFFCSLSRADTGTKFRRKFMQVVMCRRDKNNYTKLKAYDHQENPMFKRFDHRRKKVNLVGRHIIISRIRFGLPPKFILRRYKRLSEPGKDVMLEQFDANMKLAKLPKVKTAKFNTDYEGVKNAIRVNTSKYETNHSRPGRIRIEPSILRQEFHLTASDAVGIKKIMEKELSK